MRNIIVAAAAACLILPAAVVATEDKPTDLQIAHIAYTAGVIDINAAKLALSKTGNDAVKTFAQSMLSDHQAVNDQALALVKKLNVTPEDNATSQALVKAANAKQAELGALDGDAFDKAYINNEVVFHQQVLGALDKTLIPSAENADLKRFLEAGYKLFQGHEMHAERVASELK